MKILNFPYMISGVVSHTKSISKSWFERFKKHVNQKAQFFKPQKLKKKIANCNFFQLQMQCHECNFHARGLHFGFLIYRRAVVETEWMGDSCWALVRQSAF